MPDPAKRDPLSDYRQMRTIRRFEERCTALLRDGLIQGSMHLCCGQEAIAVGATAALSADDALTATYRGHGWALARGIPAADMFAEIMGRDSRLCGGRGGSAFLSSAEHGFLGENSIVGAGVPIALGAALAASRGAGNGVSLVAIGDGAMNQGSVHEALNFAAVWRLPLVVVVENNAYSELTPIRDMVRVERLSERAAGYGIPGTTVEGREVGPVAAAVGEAVARARAGDGPSLVEALCDRLVGHYSGDVQHYRPKGELAEAAQREPLVRLRQAHQELADRFDAIDAEVDAALDAAAAEAMQVPLADPQTARRHVYA